MILRKRTNFHPHRFFLFLLLFSCFRLSAQDKPPGREIFITGGINGGMIGFSPTHRQQISGNDYFIRTSNYGFGNLRSVNGQSKLALISNTSIGLHAGLTWSNKAQTQYVSISGELQKNKGCYSFNPPFLFYLQGDTFGKWVMSDKYVKYAAAIQYSWYRNDFSLLGGPQLVYIREAFGMSINHSNFDGPLVQGKFEDWSEQGTGMTATTVHASKSSPMLSSEIGLKNFSEDHKFSLDLGLVYHQPFTTSYTDEYEFFQQGNSTGVSQVTYTGATIMLNARLSWNWKLPQRPPDTTKTRPVKPDKPEIVKVDTADKRDIDVQNRMSLGSDYITIWVWDKDKIDGDIITLFLNDEVILSNYELDGGKKKIKLQLKPGYNYLVMRAENLGEIPPNTAAIEISDGKGKRTFIVNSDEGKSGAIELVYGK